MSKDPLVADYDRIVLGGSDCGDSVADRLSRFLRQWLLCCCIRIRNAVPEDLHIRKNRLQRHGSTILSLCLGMWVADCSSWHRAELEGLKAFQCFRIGRQVGWPGERWWKSLGSPSSHKLVKTLSVFWNALCSIWAGAASQAKRSCEILPITLHP